MKSIQFLLLVFVMIFGLSACGSPGEPETEEDYPQTLQPLSETEASDMAQSKETQQMVIIVYGVVAAGL